MFIELSSFNSIQDNLIDADKRERLLKSEDNRNDVDKSSSEIIHFCDGVLKKIGDENLHSPDTSKIDNDDRDHFYRKISNVGRTTLAVIDSVGENLAELFGLMPPLLKEEEERMKQNEEASKTSSLTISNGSENEERCKRSIPK
ncbi:uncharacterized protein LOC111627492 isoform X3 [Centruroides sculpturatus]|uniref:uncharacterized protein LOC111627492 isoform X3 n=1 Tax=Centruroides sculpturatus TaxID=218467 RepID=UPI000C6EB0D4|nr:uncharacterized protein LOC111627492 isoform X3 [Centruroides sculpturatus]XP_023226840.1 uncharacterized protein LOC111627492 isoform X3 [Centruroides sculpturatus]